MGTASALGALRSLGQGSRGLFSSRTGSQSQRAGGNGGTRSSGSIPVSDRRGTNGQTLSRPSNRTPTTSFIPPIPEGRTIEQQLEEEPDYDGTTANSGSGSGFEIEDGSTRKGSTASELGVGIEVVLDSSEGDSRSRERRKGTPPHR
jgi:hypothetical protein